jgi:sugar lactone lactonase YvrE
MKTNSWPGALWRRRVSKGGLAACVVVVLLLTTIAGVVAQSQAPVFPDLIQLPADFGPEGIAVDNGHTFYVGSLAPATLGQILVGDLRTGTFSELVPPTGRIAAGMKLDSRSNYLYVAGGTSGRGTIYDADSGAEIAFYQFMPPGVNGINDVVVTREAAYFTDTTRPYLGRVAIGPGGQPGHAENIPLPPNFGVRGGCTVGFSPRANGIAATKNGKFLIIIHMSEGQLYLMDTATFTVVPIDVTGGDFVGGNPVCNGDGLLLDGRTLYIAQSSLNRVAVVELSPDHLSGVVTRYITEPFQSNPATKIPTTLAEFGNSLYAVTLGSQPPTPDFVVRLPK